MVNRLKEVCESIDKDFGQIRGKLRQNIASIELLSTELDNISKNIDSLVNEYGSERTVYIIEKNMMKLLKALSKSSSTEQEVLSVLSATSRKLEEIQGSPYIIKGNVDNDLENTELDLNV